MSSEFEMPGAFPNGVWEWMLVFLIIGIMTLSHLPGLSRIIVLYGLIFSWTFLIYFLHSRLRLQPEIIIYSVWIAWSVIGVVNVTDYDLFLKQLLTILQIAMLFFLVASITALRANLSIVMLAIGIGGIIIAFSSYTTGELQMATEIETRTRAAGFTRNANSFSYHLLFVLFVIFYFWKIKPHFWWRACLLTLIFMVVIGIIYSGSRKGLLSVFAFLLLWYFFCRGRILLKKPLTNLIILIILSGGIYFTADYVMSNTLLGKRLQNDRIERGSRTRLLMYQDGFNMMKEHPFLGVGLNNYRVLSSSGLYSHSDYIEVAANTGIVGFVLYFSIYVVLWCRLNRIQKLLKHDLYMYITQLLKAAIITILIVAFGRPNIISKLTWVFLAGIIGYSWAIEAYILSKKKHD